MENCLPHGFKLLEQLGFMGGIPCPADRLKPLKYIVESDNQGEEAIQEAHHVHP